VLQAVGEGIFSVDAAGIVRLWNRAAELITGVPADRVVGRALSQVVPGWEGLAGRIPVAEAGGTPRSVTLPVEIGGSDLWLSIVAVCSADGVVYAVRDVTVERGLEEQRRDFVTTISHELRTPIAAVYGAAETLLRRDLQVTDEHGRQLLEMIATQSNRLAQIVEEVLLASRIDRGELRVGRRPVDVGELVRATVEAMEAQLRHPVAIEVEVAEGVGPASGDGDRIQQILLNLLDNAVKYGREPVRVRVAEIAGAVSVTVADAGSGIVAADRERIFEKFYRGDPELTHAPGGTGLGLYISRELARRMGGTLDVAAASEPGATFVLTLPRA
jgi:PAS domain S-box-containing protein